jgi:hypothetical protein
MQKSLICDRCKETINNSSYLVSSNGVTEHRHLLCFLRYFPMLKRSFWAASLVGTILILLNQGDFIFAGDFYKGLVWKMPLTYLVPFCVATWGAVTNSKSTYD